ncbi:hypothetical protein DMA11_16765 [Marinilabiliaceae bacterium JC017]|nr:hypothetical protein DMA11_16765 [Marinilabiliaceae bacterium JC017]
MRKQIYFIFLVLISTACVKNNLADFGPNEFLNGCVKKVTITRFNARKKNGKFIESYPRLDKTERNYKINGDEISKIEYDIDENVICNIVYDSCGTTGINRCRCNYTNKTIKKTNTGDKLVIYQQYNNKGKLLKTFRYDHRLKNVPVLDVVNHHTGDSVRMIYNGELSMEMIVWFQNKSYYYDREIIKRDSHGNWTEQCVYDVNDLESADFFIRHIEYYSFWDILLYYLD